jgi:nucleotide-binding universal stress UspA family protein
MNKKILLAVDGSENSRRAVQYTAEVIGCTKGFSVTLLYIERLPDRDLFINEEDWCRGCKKNTQAIDNFLVEARGILEGQGVAEDKISTSYVNSCRSPLSDNISNNCSMGTSVAQDILKFLDEGGFDTVVIGRRGMTKAEEFLFGSVSSKIVHHARGCTVWVVV